VLPFFSLLTEFLLENALLFGTHSQVQQLPCAPSHPSAFYGAIMGQNIFTNQTSHLAKFVCVLHAEPPLATHHALPKGKNSQRASQQDGNGLPSRAIKV
jgi:hypothetical protein